MKPDWIKWILSGCGAVFLAVSIYWIGALNARISTLSETQSQQAVDTANAIGELKERLGKVEGRSDIVLHKLDLIKTIEQAPDVIVAPQNAPNSR